MREGLHGARMLVVEDDPLIGPLLRDGFRQQGMVVFLAGDGRTAIRAASDEPIDVVLMDVGLPDMDGLRVCRTVRHLQPEAVVIMVTARDDEMDVISGLEAGADDYVTKPFSMMVLQARVRAHLRRMIAPGQFSELLRCGDLVIDTGGRSCRLGNVEVRLRLKQFDLLTRLAISAGDAVSREDLMTDVWDRNWQGTTKTLDVHIAGLRQRLAEAGDELSTRGAGYRSVQIRTVHRVGYKLVCSGTGPDATAGEQRR